MRALIITACVVVALVVLLAIGLLIQPRSFAPAPGEPAAVSTVPLPYGLPAPVDRFYRAVYGEEVPLISSAVISGRATMRPFPGPALPARYRFIHDAGEGYRHHIEATLFGVPIMTVDERYVDGSARMVLPFGTFEDEPELVQGANLALWAESIWLPALFVTDPRVRWEPVDDETALLVVPFGDAEERFVVRFDPVTGLVTLFESMRYQGVDSEEKTLWINEVLEWGRVDGYLVPVRASVTWYGASGPWATFTAEEIVYNRDVDEYLRSTGP